MLVTNSHQKQSSFGAVDGDLADDFIERLAEKFFSDGADAFVPGLAMFQGLIEGFFEPDDVFPFCFLVGDILHEVLVV